jgi:hypothetical protein
MKKGVWNVKGWHWGREEKTGWFLHLVR